MLFYVYDLFLMHTGRSHHGTSHISVLEVCMFIVSDVLYLLTGVVPVHLDVTRRSFKYA